MNKKFQKFGAWCGIVGSNIFFIGMIVAHFFPPIPASLTALEVQANVQTNVMAIRIGALMMIVGGMGYGPFLAAVFLQLKRMEGVNCFGAYAQLASGIANIQFFILPGVFFAVLAFRPDRAPDALYALSDLAWIVTLLPWSVSAMQCFCTGVAILSHPEVTNVYPRWAGYLTIWLSICMATSSVIPFFKTGPFAWHGLFGFWIPSILFGIYIFTFWWITLKAIDTQEDM